MEPDGTPAQERRSPAAELSLTLLLLPSSAFTLFLLRMTVSWLSLTLDLGTNLPVAGRNILLFFLSSTAAGIFLCLRALQAARAVRNGRVTVAKIWLWTFALGAFLLIGGLGFLALGPALLLMRDTFGSREVADGTIRLFNKNWSPVEVGVIVLGLGTVGLFIGRWTMGAVSWMRGKASQKE